MNVYESFARPLYVMLKPIGAVCNLACEYCYYREKAKLYPGERQMMDEGLLEMFIQQYIDAQMTPYVLFVWHGGEPLMHSLSFYQKAIELQCKYANGHIIGNCIQTNGTLLSREWCKFFHDNKWLVGVSIDGSQKYHDKFRKSVEGESSFAKVIQGIHLLQEYQVEWNALVAVNAYNANDPLDVYHFLKRIGCRYIQFSPVVERICRHTDGRYLAIDKEDAEIADFSVTPEQWGFFLCRIFDEWVENDVGLYYIQLFDAVLANWIGVPPGVCILDKTCGHAAAMEFNGDLYVCDHFVFPQYKLGNISSQPLVEMMYGETQSRFGMSKQENLSLQCKSCKYLFVCNGECPKNRFCKTNSGEVGLNYLCKGYYRFFEHAEPYMDYMKYELLNKRAPANVMQFARRCI